MTTVLQVLGTAATIDVTFCAEVCWHHIDESVNEKTFASDAFTALRGINAESHWKPAAFAVAIEPISSSSSCTTIIAAICRIIVDSFEKTPKKCFKEALL
jgi:hypothetical protein